MSWLRDHFHEFVFPAFIAAEKKSTEMGAPFHITPSRFAPERLPTELKKLWTLCREHNIEWSYDVRVLNTHHGTSKYRETARIHNKILRSSADAALTAMKRERCSRLLFPGRDIYMLVPICARKGIPFLFVPELSRPNSEVPAMRAFLERLGIDGTELVIDTGYYGTIPANLKKLFPEFEFPFRFMSESDKADPRDRFHARPHQFFPNRKDARAEAVESEYLAKYWKSGTTDAEGNIVQFFADKRSIQRAALLTAMLFRGIPFWKVAAPKAKNAPVVYGFNQVGMVNAGAIFTNNVMNITTAGTSTVNYVFGGVTANQTPLTQAAAMQALAAVPQATGGQQIYGPPLIPGQPPPPALPAAPPPPTPAPGAPIALLPPAPTTPTPTTAPPTAVAV